MTGEQRQHAPGSSPDWDRFGRGDRRGALNYIDQRTVLSALTSVHTGEVIPLNRSLYREPAARTGRMSLRKGVRFYNEKIPLDDGRFMIVNDEYVTFDLQAGSHIDSLAHIGLLEVGSDAVFYGGAGLESVGPGPIGHTLGIDAMGGAIVTRGVLVDLTRLLYAKRGYLPPETIVTRGAIEDALEAQQVRLRRGDALLLYVGQEKRTRDLPRDPDDSPGTDASCLGLFRESEVALVASDNLAVEIVPELPDHSAHLGALRNLGIPLGELWSLARLRSRCESDARYDFLLVCVPLNIEGAIATPANAVALR